MDDLSSDLGHNCTYRRARNGVYEWRGGSTTVEELMKCYKTIYMKWVSSDLRVVTFETLQNF
jgi:hypothetical protein